MNATDHFKPDEESNELRRLLRENRPEPSLPPGFRQAVWRRVERLEAPIRLWTADSLIGWLRSLVPQPRLALATITAMLLVGATLGVRQGLEQAQEDAKGRYFAAVSPAPLR